MVKSSLHLNDEKIRLRKQRKKTLKVKRVTLAIVVRNESKVYLNEPRILIDGNVNHDYPEIELDYLLTQNSCVFLSLLRQR